MRLDQSGTFMSWLSIDSGQILVPQDTGRQTFLSPEGQAARAQWATVQCSPVGELRQSWLRCVRGGKGRAGRVKG